MQSWLTDTLSISRASSSLTLPYREANTHTLSRRSRGLQFKPGLRVDSIVLPEVRRQTIGCIRSKPSCSSTLLVQSSRPTQSHLLIYTRAPPRGTSDWIAGSALQSILTKVDCLSRNEQVSPETLFRSAVVAQHVASLVNTCRWWGPVNDRSNPTRYRYRYSRLCKLVAPLHYLSVSGMIRTE